MRTASFKLANPSLGTSHLDTLIGFGVALLPLFHLTVKSWTNGWLAILGVLSLVSLTRGWRKDRRLFESWQTTAVFACLLAPLVGIIIAQIGRLDWFWKAQDGPSRLVLAALLFLTLRHKNIHFLPYFKRVCSASIIITFFSILTFRTATAAWGGRFATYFVDCDTFGQHILLLTFLTFLMAQMNEAPSLIQQVLDYAAVACGGLLALGSQTRGAWLAVIPLAIIWLVAMRKKPEKIASTCLIATVVFGLIMIFNHDLRDRILSIYHEIHLWFSGHNPDTSAGLRLTMWKMTWVLFQNSPFFGYGEYENFRHLLDQPMLTSFASELARETIKNGPHNQLAAEALRSGLFGVIYTLGYFIVPAFIFLERVRSLETNVRRSAIVGIAVIVAFSVFSLTLEVFNLKFAVSFFGFLIAGLSADCLTDQTLSDQKRDAIQSGARIEA